MTDAAPPTLPVTLAINSRAAQRLRGGHPWVYANEITNLSMLKDHPAGVEARLTGPNGTILGRGFANRHSLIALRLATRGDAPLNDAFFLNRLRRALVLRDRLFPTPYYRLVHAEGDRLPGLVIDRFNTVFSVQLNSAGADLHAPLIVAALQQLFPNCALVIRRDAPARAHEGLDVIDAPEVIGTVPASIAVPQNGVIYRADLLGGQKTGWYYDQTANHALIAGMAKDKSLLDLCTHAGGFTLAALHQGATRVVAVDGSGAALDLARMAATENKLAANFIRVDMFDHLANDTATYDIVVADPPPFARSKKDIEAAARGYRKLAKLAAARVAQNGILAIASCSHNISLDRFAVEVAAGIAAAGRSGAIIFTTGAGPDHPVPASLPESAYLKMLTIQLD